MKKLGILWLLSLLTAQSHAETYTTIQDLKIQCTGTWTITKVIKATYEPEVPAHGRAPGMKASEYIEAQAVVTGFQDEDCKQLETKYKFDLKQPFNVAIWPRHVESQGHVNSVAQTLIGQVIPFKVQQYFGYVVDHDYLPLFPAVVSENISLIATDSAEFSAQASLPMDPAQVYGATPVATWNDDQKVALAQKISGAMGNLANLIDLRDFHELFLGLEVQAPAAKKVLLQIIWKKFNQASGSFGQLFNFEVGGQGAYVGHPFAKKLNMLANEVATDQEKEMLIFQFPHLLVPGGFSNVPCMNISTQSMHKILEQWKNLYPTFTSSQAAQVTWALQKISVPKNPFWDDVCVATVQKDGNQVFATEILQAIQP